MYGAKGAPAPSSAAPVPSSRVLEGQVYTHTHTHTFSFSPQSPHRHIHAQRCTHTDASHKSHTHPCISMLHTDTHTRIYRNRPPCTCTQARIRAHTQTHTVAHAHRATSYTLHTPDTHVCMCRDRHTDALWTHKRAHSHRCAHIRSQTRVLTSLELPPWSEGHTKCVSSIQACADLAGLAHQGRMAWGCRRGQGWW